MATKTSYVWKCDKCSSRNSKFSEKCFSCKKSNPTNIDKRQTANYLHPKNEKIERGTKTVQSKLEDRQRYLDFDDKNKKFENNRGNSHAIQLNLLLYFH